MELSLLFSVIVVLALLKVSELHYLSKKMCRVEPFKTDRSNIVLTSSDDAYKPDFVPIQIDVDKQEGSDLDPDVCLYNGGRSEVNKMYGSSDSDPKYSNKDDILYLYDQLSGPVDLGMANVMSAISKRSKESLTNRSRATVNTYSKYFKDEFDGHENSRWWDNDELEIAM